MWTEISRDEEGIGVTLYEEDEENEHDEAVVVDEFWMTWTEAELIEGSLENVVLE